MEHIDLTKIKTVFFIGIGGIGISALAKMALSRGMEVGGVNDEDSPKTLDPLRDAGVTLSKIPFDMNTLPEADLYVYSDAWLFRGPEIIEAARKTGKLVLNYADALGVFTKDYKVIAVAGTHGKTTTTAMIAEILIDAGLDPTVLVGSFVQKFNSNFRKGAGEYFVVEADEYNRHFLSLRPCITVITNIEADHLDYYKDLADVQNAFAVLKSQSENVVEDYRAYVEKVPKLSVPGMHNRLNAAAALAVADILRVDEAQAQKSVSHFTGTWRRLEKKGETENGTVIYDDYAHHPTEIQASLQALRELYPKESNKKITVLFQPHLYSRTKALFDDFVKSFTDADTVFLLPIYFAREKPDPTVSSERLSMAICLEGGNSRSFPDFSSAETVVSDLNFGPDDVFVTMGAGEAYKVADKVFKLSPLDSK